MANLIIDVKDLDLFKEMLKLLKETLADPNVPQKHRGAYEVLRKKYKSDYYLGDDGNWYTN